MAAIGLTFQDIYEEIQERMADTSADMLVVIKRAINLAYAEMVRSAPRHKSLLMYANLTVADTNRSVSVPTGCNKIHQLQKPGGGAVPLLPWPVFNDLVTDVTASGNALKAAAEQAGSIYFYPVANATSAGTYKLGYFKLPDALSATSDVSIFGGEWDGVLMAGAETQVRGAEHEEVPQHIYDTWTSGLDALAAEQIASPSETRPEVGAG